MCRELFRNVAEKQVKGLMFHSDMADYYNFLNIRDFKEYHEKQYLEESKNFRKTKNYFIDKYHQTLVLGPFGESLEITPKEWEDKVTADVDKDTEKVLLKKSLENYYAWEEETCTYYKEIASKLFEQDYFEEYKYLRSLIDEVELEKIHITSWMSDLAVVDYNINKVKNFFYKT